MSMLIMRPSYGGFIYYLFFKYKWGHVDTSEVPVYMSLLFCCFELALS